ncbi:MAG: DUF3667 domain-containing protein [Pontixanthobacter sp.]
MNDLTEGIGDAVIGAAAARSVEPNHDGDRMAADAREDAGLCLNCGTGLRGTHCHGCGQSAHVHRTLGAFFHDLLHGVLHFEGKIWRTLPMLIWQPGRLTREYIDGARARYVSPIAMFLFVAFLTFAAWNMLGGAIEIGDADPEAEVELAETIDAAREELAKAQAALAEPGLSGPQQSILQADVDTAANQLRVLEGIHASLFGEAEEQPAQEENAVEMGRDLSAGFADGLAGKGAASESETAIEAALRRAQQNLQLTIYKLQTNAYKFSWILIPLSVPFVWLLFAFTRRFRAYDHTVFATYSITFMTALVAIASVFGYFGMGPVAAIMLFYAPFHMYRQLRGTYDLGRFAAIWRMLLLSLFAWFAIALFLIILSVMVA